MHARHPAFDERVERALGLLVEAAETHAGRIVQASSLGAEDQVVTDLIARYRLPITVATLDTGKLHGETLALIGTVRERYAIAIERYRPVHEAVVTFVGRHGDDAMRESVELRKACCALRKVEPLGRMLAGRERLGHRPAARSSRASAATSSSRKPTTPAAPSSIRSPTGAGPTSGTTSQTYDVPYNALHDRFYPSIGCAPCTRAVAVGEDIRAGRWWWEQGAKECGLHVEPLRAGRWSDAA